MNKQEESIVRIKLKAQEATPAPPVGPILGQHGINLPKFCKEFNNLTAKIDKGNPVSVIINIARDRSFKISIKTVITSFLLNKFAKPQKSTSSFRIISKEDIDKIIEIKKQDLTGADDASMRKTILGTARSMNIKEE